MTEEGGGKIKNKRSHAPSKPYERRKSFLGTFTDTVKAVIAPSWLSDLVKSVKKTPPKEESQENETVSQQNSTLKKQHVPPPAFVPLNKNGIPKLSHAPTSGEPKVIVTDQATQGFTSSQLPLSKTTFVKPHAPLIDDNQSDKSDTTSGCSSMLPHPPSTQRNRTPLDFPAQKTASYDEKLDLGDSPFNTTLDEELQLPRVKLNRSATWTAEYNTKANRHPVVSSKPGFDASLFGSLQERKYSQRNESCFMSPFYPGKTTYGGAMSHKSRLNQTAPTMVSSPYPVRQKMQAKPANSTSTSTAKRILATLQKMSTPLSDARKIPTEDTVWLNSSFNSSYRNPGRHSIGAYLNSQREVQHGHQGPPRGKLSVPVEATIAKNHQIFSRPTTSKEDSEEKIQKESGPHSAHSSTNREQVEISKSAGGKVKDKKFSSHLPKRDMCLEEEQEIPNLKTDFTLPVQNISGLKFDLKPSSEVKFANSTESSNSDVFTFSSPVHNTKVTKNTASPPRMAFQFSSPIRIDGDSSSKKVTFAPVSSTAFTPNSLMTSTNVGKAQFEVNSEKENHLKQGISPLGGGGFKPASQLKQGSVMDVLGTPPSSGGFQPASQLKQGSVMDILGKSTQDGLKPSNQLKEGSVMDILGSQKNSPKTTSGSEAKASVTKESTGNLSTLFKTPAGSWTCDTCLIQNKSDVSKCVACQSNKPVTTGDSTTKQSSGNLSTLFKTPAGNWTCDTCLIQNKADVSKCVACQANKPAAINSKKESSTLDSSLMSKFKKPAGNWDCDVCLVPNKADMDKCIACETPRPGSQPSTSGFKINPGAFSTQTGFICKSSSSSGGFKFGTGSADSQSDQTSQKDSGFVFGTTSKEKTTDVSSGFKFGASDSGKTPEKQGGFKFGNSLKEGKGEETKGGFKLGTYIDEGKGEIQGGFQFGNSLKEGKEEEIKGGFKFGTSSDGGKSDIQGGFKFGNSLKDRKGEEVKGGFKFGTSGDRGKSDIQGGFKFGTSGDEGKSDVQGGFKFGTSGEGGKSAATEGGFKFLNSDGVMDPSSQSGFKFDATVSKSSIQSSSGLQENCKPGENISVSSSSSSSSNGLIVNQTSENNSLFNKIQVSETTSASVSSFTFGQKSATVNNEPSASNQQSAFNTAFSGFQTQSSVLTTNTENKKTVATGPSLNSGITLKTLTENSGKAINSVENSTGFNFSKSDDTKDRSKPFSMPSGTAAFTMPTKRSADEDEGPAVKKAVSIRNADSVGGASTFQMKNNAQSFSFGQQTTVANSTNNSIFGQQTAAPSSAVNSVFGQQSTTLTSTPNPVFGQQQTVANAVFSFGSKSNDIAGNNSQAFGGATPVSSTNTSSSVFQFKASETTTNSSFQFKASDKPASSPFDFKTQASNQGFGASFGAPAAPMPFGGGPSFGGSNTTSTPAFGASAPANPSQGLNFNFGSTNSSSNGANQTGAVFQFGAQKPVEKGVSGGGQPPAAVPGGLAAATPNGVFNFGQTQNTGGLNFPTQPSFNFGAAPTPGTPGSNIGTFNVGSRDSGRKILRASRKKR